MMFASVNAGERNADRLRADGGSVEQLDESGGGAGGDGGGRNAPLDGDEADLVSRQLADLLDQPYNCALCGAGRQSVELQ
jgi:hypothetical protein